jgi:hypothetical protein
MSARLKSNPCITWTKPAPSVAEPVRPWHLNFVEKNRPAPHRFAAEIVESAGSHASRVHGHEESTDAARTVFGATGTGEYQDRIGLIGNADRGFLAIEHITRVT